MPEHNDFGGNADERAMTALSPSAAMRARTSSRNSGTSQASTRLPPSDGVPAKTSKKGRASGSLSPIQRPRAPSPSRRKAGAETNAFPTPNGLMSPRSSSPERAGRAPRALSPIPGPRGHSSKPVGHTSYATQWRLADGPLQPVGQARAVTQTANADGPIESGGAGQSIPVTQDAAACAAAIDELLEQWKRRQMWHRAEKSLTLQAKAMCRRLMLGDKKEAEVLYKSSLNGGEHEQAANAYLAMFPLLEARKGIEVARLQVEKRLLVLAKQLPVAAWIEGVRGVGLLSLAGIVGEAGDLGSYSNPAKLWKRMGLAVIGGGRQRKVTGEAALEHGYSPPRRSLMWTIGDCIIRAGGPLKELYNERKPFELEKTEKIAADPVERKKYTGEGGKYAPLAHAHNRAKRYIEKRLLRDLWRAWRDATHAVLPKDRARPSEVIQ